MYGLSLHKPSSVHWQSKPIVSTGRLMRLLHNFNVRVIDVGVWMGIVSASAVLIATGGQPTKLNLSPKNRNN